MAQQDAEMFDMDSEDTAASSTIPVEEPAGSSGRGTPREGGHDKSSKATAPAGDGIELSRRAVPVVEVEDDVCSICLDSFSEEDPGMPTVCNHSYHLQCIMQWAQRSRECPMCFKQLHLQDPDMDALLPFGEYISPEARAAANVTPHLLMGLEAWELERLLHRLALGGAGGHTRRGHNGRRHRAGSVAARVAAAVGSMGAGPSTTAPPATSSSNPQTPSAPRAIAGAAAAADGAEVGEGSATAAGNDADEGHLTSAPIDPEGFPSSWPPAAIRTRAAEQSAGGALSPRADRGGGTGGMALDFKAAQETLKSRWAAASRSFSRTTRELKARLGGGRGSGQPTSPHPNDAAVGS